jgi:hypothetical protein
LKTVVTDAVDRPGYFRSIEVPIAGWLSSHDLQDKVLH